MTTPTRLRAWLSQKEISQVALAQAMRVSETLVSLVANGQRPASTAFIERFALVFGATDTAALFGASHAEEVT